MIGLGMTGEMKPSLTEISITQWPIWGNGGTSLASSQDSS